MQDVLNGQLLAVIGAGAMARALIVGLIKAGVSPDAITCTRRSPERLGALALLGVNTTADNAAAVAGADIVLLAVKPQGWRDCVDACRRAFRPGQILVSILAGVTTKALAAALPEGVDIVRAMPNTPALVGLGMTGFCLLPSSPERTAVADEAARAIFGASGQALLVDEGLMDAVTATSGSGPAYVFYLAEAMRDGAVRLGLDPDSALTLVAQTFRGASELLLQPGADPVTLRTQVTSPKGSTAEAIAVLESGQVRVSVAHAMEAGRHRAEELGRE